MSRRDSAYRCHIAIEAVAPNLHGLRSGADIDKLVRALRRAGERDRRRVAVVFRDPEDLAPDDSEAVPINDRLGRLLGAAAGDHHRTTGREAAALRWRQWIGQLAFETDRCRALVKVGLLTWSQADCEEEFVDPLAARH
jgi:hypothetical protein